MSGDRYILPEGVPSDEDLEALFDALTSDLDEEDEEILDEED